MSYADAIALMQKGRANPSDYQVVFPTRVTELAEDSDFADYIGYYCRAATLPGTNHSVLSLTGQENVGIARNVITGKSYGSPAVFTFSDRADLLVYNTLNRWMELSVLNSGQRDTTGRSLRINYYDSVKCDILVYKLEPENVGGIRQDRGFRERVTTGIWKLINCVPIGIEQTTLAVEAADSLLDFTIAVGFESFSYTPVVNTQPDLESVITGGR